MKKIHARTNNIVVTCSVIFVLFFYTHISFSYAQVPTQPPIDHTVNVSAVVPAPITLDDEKKISGFNPCGWLDYLCQNGKPINEVKFTEDASDEQPLKIQKHIIEETNLDSQKVITPVQYISEGATGAKEGNRNGVCYTYTCPLVHYLVTLLLILCIENIFSIVFVKRNEILFLLYFIISFFVCIVLGVYFYDDLYRGISLVIALHIITLTYYSHYFFKKEEKQTNLLYTNLDQ